MLPLTKTQRLAAHLLNLYWCGAGDAGMERVIFNYHENFSFSNKHLPSKHREDQEAKLQKTLEDSRSTRISLNETLTDYFFNLAELILGEIGEETKPSQPGVTISSHLAMGIYDVLERVQEMKDLLTEMQAGNFNWETSTVNPETNIINPNNNDSKPAKPETQRLGAGRCRCRKNDLCSHGK